MATLINLLLLMCLCSSFAHVIPVQTGDPTDTLTQDPRMQEHHMMSYHRPILHPAPIAPVPVVPVGGYYNYYRRRPSPQPPQRPRSKLFQPTDPNQRFSPPGGSSTGLSYVNNLLSGVNGKIYGKPGPSSSGTGLGFPSVPTNFGTPTTSTGFGIPTGSTFGNPGTGFPGGPGGSVTDVFGPGIAPAALDLPDPSSGNAGSSGSPSGPGDGSTGVVINEPTVPVNPGQPINQPVQPAPVDPMLFMDQQSDTWFWPDQIVTGALPSIHLGASSPSSSSSSNANVPPPPALQAAGPPPPSNINNQPGLGVVLPGPVAGSVSVPAFGGMGGGARRTAPFMALGNTQEASSRDSLQAESLQTVANVDPQLLLDQQQLANSEPGVLLQQQQVPLSSGLINNNDPGAAGSDQQPQQTDGRLSAFLSRGQRA